MPGRRDNSWSRTKAKAGSEAGNAMISGSSNGEWISYTSSGIPEGPPIGCVGVSGAGLEEEGPASDSLDEPTSIEAELSATEGSADTCLDKAEPLTTLDRPGGGGGAAFDDVRAGRVEDFFFGET